MKDIDLRILGALASNGYELAVLEIQAKLTKNPDSWWSGFVSPSIGAIYVAGGRLEERGLIQKVSRPGGPERGNRPRMFFRITGEGLAVSKTTPA